MNENGEGPNSLFQFFCEVREGVFRGAGGGKTEKRWKRGPGLEFHCHDGWPLHLPSLRPHARHMRLASRTTHSCLRPALSLRPLCVSSNLHMASRPAVTASAAHTTAAPRPAPDTRPVDNLAAHAEKAWAWWDSMGAPKLHVAPMVDQVR
jgi:hypothetical protein